MSNNPNLDERRGRAAIAWWARKTGGVQTCALCEKAALWKVGTKGYCKAHQAEAKAHNAALQSAKRYQARKDGTDFFPE